MRTPQGHGQGGEAETSTLSQLRRSSVGGRILAEIVLDIARHPQVLRRELVDRLGVSSATISKGIADLSAAGLVVEGAVKPSGGRPVGCLMLDERTYGCIGIHVTATGDESLTFNGAVTTLAGTVVAEAPTPGTALLTGSRTPKAEATDTLAAYASDLVAQCRRLRRSPLGIGVQIGGHVNGGRLIWSGNTRIADLALRAGLAGRLPSPVVVENDATALAVHEHLYGKAGREHQSSAIVGIFHGGIGGGLIIAGRPWRGSGGLASEPGHLPVDDSPGALECRCGERGHLESILSPGRILQRLRDAGLVVPDLATAVETAPAALAEALETSGRALGRALVQLVLWLNPALVIVHLPNEMVDRRLKGALQLAVDRQMEGAISTGRATPVEYRGYTAAEMTDLHSRSAAAVVLENLLTELAGSG